MKTLILSAFFVSTIFALTSSSTAKGQVCTNTNPSLAYKNSLYQPSTSQKAKDEAALKRLIHELVAATNEADEFEKQYQSKLAELKVSYGNLLLMKRAFEKGLDVGLTYEEFAAMVTKYNTALDQNNEAARQIAKYRELTDQQIALFRERMGQHISQYGESAVFIQSLKNIVSTEIR